MNPQDLRIGNNIQQGIIHKITHTHVKVINKHREQQTLQYGKITPIPITKEWLERLWCRNTPLNENLFSCGILSLYLEDDGDVTVSRLGIVNGRCYLTTLKYVHQLQNLYYAITGEELEIINSEN